MGATLRGRTHVTQDCLERCRTTLHRAMKQFSPHVGRRRKLSDQETRRGARSTIRVAQLNTEQRNAKRMTRPLRTSFLDRSLDAALPCGRNSPCAPAGPKLRLPSSALNLRTQPPFGASAQPSRRLTAYTEHGRGCVRITRSGTNFPFGWADVRGEISASAAHSLASSILIRQPQPRPSPRPSPRASPRASPRPLPEPCSCF